MSNTFLGLRKTKRLLSKLLNFLLIVFLRLFPTPDMILMLARFLYRLKCYNLSALCCHRAMRLEKYDFGEDVFVIPEKVVSDNCCPKVSVIVPTYNRADSLERCLNSILCQTLSQDLFEVIVVNNNCTDRTHEVCENFLGKIKNFKEVVENIPGLLAGRHAGWRASFADILTFCDDDIEAFPEWLETIISVFDKNPDVVIAGGNCIGKYDFDLPGFFKDIWTDRGTFKRNTYHSLIENISEVIEDVDPNNIFGCNFSVRRKIVEESTGFGPDCMEKVLFQGDGENRVCNISKAHGKAILHPDISVFHNMPRSRMSDKYFIKRGCFDGMSSAYMYFRSKTLGDMTIIDQRNCKNEFLVKYAVSFNDAVYYYIDVFLHSYELRKWVARPHYIGFEKPPDLLMETKEILSNINW